MAKTFQPGSQESGFFFCAFAAPDAGCDSEDMMRPEIGIALYLFVAA
jgi:hypothetical protein